VSYVKHLGCVRYLACSFQRLSFLHICSVSQEGCQLLPLKPVSKATKISPASYFWDLISRVVDSYFFLPNCPVRRIVWPDMQQATKTRNSLSYSYRWFPLAVNVPSVGYWVCDSCYCCPIQLRDRRGTLRSCFWSVAADKRLVASRDRLQI